MRKKLKQALNDFKQKNLPEIHTNAFTGELEYKPTLSLSILDELFMMASHAYDFSLMMHICFI